MTGQAEGLVELRLMEIAVKGRIDDQLITFTSNVDDGLDDKCQRKCNLSRTLTPKQKNAASRGDESVIMHRDEDWKDDRSYEHDQLGECIIKFGLAEEGYAIYPSNRSPRFLDCQIQVLKDDSSLRQSGGLLTDLPASNLISALVGLTGLANPIAGAAGGAASLLYSLVATTLKNNKDDLWANWDFTLECPKERDLFILISNKKEGEGGQKTQVDVKLQFKRHPAV